MLTGPLDWKYMFYLKTSGPIGVNIPPDSWYYFTTTTYPYTSAKIATDKGVPVILTDALTDNVPATAIIENDIIYNPLGYGG